MFWKFPLEVWNSFFLTISFQSESLFLPRDTIAGILVPKFFLSSTEPVARVSHHTDFAKAVGRSGVLASAASTRAAQPQSATPKAAASRPKLLGYRPRVPCSDPLPALWKVRPFLPVRPGLLHRSDATPQDPDPSKYPDPLCEYFPDRTPPSRTYPSEVCLPDPASE
jgi:hypothetical protein